MDASVNHFHLFAEKKAKRLAYFLIFIYLCTHITKL